MNINFTARHTEITPDVKKYCERRIQSIEKLLGFPVDADMILSVEKYRHKVEINVKAKGTTFNTVEETQDTLSSLNIAFDNIDKRIKKEKEKYRERKRRKSKDREVFSIPEEPGEQRPRIILYKDYSLKPMSLDEALMMFETGKNEIFVFRKFDSEKWSVLYRRKDGNIGLVELE
jgi:putative sigma-54 modulation protein